MYERPEYVQSVHLYPIKSCQQATVDGELPSCLRVAETGFTAYDVRDREFVIAEAEPLRDHSLLFVSQRGWNETGRAEHRGDNVLASVETDITATALTVRSHIGELALDSRYHDDGKEYDVRIHKYVLPNAIDQGDEAADYFSGLLERPVRLLRANRAVMRRISPERRRPDASNSVAAADAYPFLLTNQATLNALHRAAGMELGTIPMNRFRPNIVIEGSGVRAMGEDLMREVVIGGLYAHVVKPCDRCPIPNIDQQTGSRDVPAGLKLLKYHRGRLPGDEKARLFFGQNLNPVFRSGVTVHRGDKVRVIRQEKTPNFAPVR
ncbi:MAG TPA: MOSC N-terminal beta barrel domain-containing protein [Candidatus Saccharimonadales bacterium]|nr:MOSC N-terminal beta barrel domain-containing protein [Candidatus Saccharimonadales bacterium]